MATATRTSKTNKFGDSSRFYEIEERRYPSVTTILGVVPKPWMGPWSAKMERELVVRASADLYEDLPKNAPAMSRPAYITSLTERLGKVKAYVREVEKATDIGSQAHGRVEWINRTAAGQVAGPEPHCVKEALWASMAYEDWLRQNNVKVLHVEQTLWHGDLGYAGTADFIGTLDGKLTLFDLKTSKAIYPESHLQVAAYAKAYEWMGHGVPEQGYIVRIPKKTTDPGFETKLIPDIDVQFKHFLALFEVWKWQESLKAEG